MAKRETTTNQSSLKRLLGFIQRNGAALTLIGTAVGALVGWSLPVFHDYFEYKKALLDKQIADEADAVKAKQRESEISAYVADVNRKIGNYDGVMLDRACQTLDVLNRFGAPQQLAVFEFRNVKADLVETADVIDDLRKDTESALRTVEGATFDEVKNRTWKLSRAISEFRDAIDEISVSQSPMDEESAWNRLRKAAAVLIQGRKCPH